MRLKELVNENREYEQAENEIREWVEKTYDGLSVDFYPHLEIVRTKNVDIPKDRVAKIVEVVNIKIDEILESKSEQILFAGWCNRIWKKHPEFNPQVDSLDALKKHKKFLKYLKELRIKGVANGN